MPPVEELGIHLEDIFGGDPEIVAFHLESKLIAVQRIQEDEESESEYELQVQEMLGKSELIELPKVERELFISRLQRAAQALEELGRFPSFLVVGSRDMFFACLGLPEAERILGMPVHEEPSYPDNRAAMAGSSSSLAPISGVTHGVCFGVSLT